MEVSKLSDGFNGSWKLALVVWRHFETQKTILMEVRFPTNEVWWEFEAHRNGWSDVSTQLNIFSLEMKEFASQKIWSVS